MEDRAEMEVGSDVSECATQVLIPWQQLFTCDFPFSFLLPSHIFLQSLAPLVTSSIDSLSPPPHALPSTSLSPLHLMPLSPPLSVSFTSINGALKRVGLCLSTSLSPLYLTNR